MISKNTDHLIQLFIEQIQKDEVKNTFKILQNLSESLEEKNDPDMEELILYESVNMVLEKVNLLQNKLKNKTIRRRRKLPGNLLNDLYDKNDIIN